MVNKKTHQQDWQRKYVYTPRGGSPTIRLDGYIDLGHDDGLSAVDSMVIQTPVDANDRQAIVRVSVTTRKGTFSAHGTATPSDVKDRKDEEIADPTHPDKPLIQMAEARALTRALAIATNNGIGDDASASIGEEATSTTTAQRTARTSKPDLKPVPNQDDRPLSSSDNRPPSDERPVTQTQLITITKLSQQLDDPIDPDPEMGHDAAEELIRNLQQSLRQARQQRRRA